MRLPESLRVAGVEERLRVLGISMDNEGVEGVGVGAPEVMGTSAMEKLAMLG